MHDRRIVNFFFHFDYILCSVLSVVVYLPLCSWIALLVGIKSRSQARALLVTLLLLFGWAFLPVLVFVNDQPEAIVESLLSRPPVAVAACLCSPSVIILINETDGLNNVMGTNDHLAFTLINFSVYGLGWWWLRRWCLARSNQLLGRIADDDTDWSPQPAGDVS